MFVYFLIICILLKCLPVSSLTVHIQASELKCLSQVSRHVILGKVYMLKIMRTEKKFLFVWDMYLDRANTMLERKIF